MEKLTLETLPTAVENLVQSQTLILDGMAKIQNQLKGFNDSSQEELPINIKEASKIIGRAVGTIYNKINNHSIPHYKEGGKIYFFKSELLEWLRKGKVETNLSLYEGKNERLNNVFHNRKQN